MRALVLHGPRDARVDDVPEPVASPGEVVVDVELVGICGTDVELYSGQMAYFGQGHSSYPLRPGHEWAGRVSRVGDGVDVGLLGLRVTGDTMMGCGLCDRCQRARQHLCAFRGELGVRDGRPGALAERLAFPARFLQVIPEHVSVAAAAMVEPGGNALRAAEAAAVPAGQRLLVLGAGTIGLLVTMFALAGGTEVHVVGRRETSLRLARELGARAWRTDELEALSELVFASVVDATSDAAGPRNGLRFVEPGGRLVLIGLSGEPSLIDTRDLALADVSALGILSASPAMARTVSAYAGGAVVPDVLVAEVVALEEVAERLEGRRGPGAGPGPKVLVDPRPSATR
jgi:2-desacetyl-2-hydroxyethyl bacteriochlorophyllide A dehydrogenase